MGKSEIVRKEPRFELWNLEFPAQVTTLQFVQFGVQAATIDRAMAAAEALQPLLALADAPNEMSRGLYIDEAGATN